MRLSGSFRGVPFECVEDSAESGRRVDVYEYPYRDTPGTTDLGRRAKRFTLSAYTLASNAPALTTALDAAGPGLLVHPSLGGLTVAVEGYSQRASARDLRHVYYELNFVEAGPAELVVEVDLVAGLTDAAGAAAASAAAYFAATLRALDGTAAQIRAATATVRQYTVEGPLAYTLRSVTDTTIALQELDAAAVAAVNAPANYAAQVISALAAIGSLSVLQLLTGQNTGTATPLPPTGTTADRENREAIRRLYASASLAAHAAQLSAEVPPARPNALAALDLLAARLDIEAALQADTTLGDLRAAAVSAVGAKIRALPAVDTVTYESPTDWLREGLRLNVAAETLGDLNGTAHPLFVVGAQAVIRGSA